MSTYHQASSAPKTWLVAEVESTTASQVNRGAQASSSSPPFIRLGLRRSNDEGVCEACAEGPLHVRVRYALEAHHVCVRLVHRSHPWLRLICSDTIHLPTIQIMFLLRLYCLYRGGTPSREVMHLKFGAQHAWW